MLQESLTIAPHSSTMSTSRIAHHWGNVSPPPPLGSSDHRCISISLRWLSKTVIKVKRIVWLYSKADWDSANAELRSVSSPNTDDVNSILSSWNHTFLSVLSRHIPQKIISNRKRTPWLNPHIFRLLRKRDLSYSRAKAPTPLLPGLNSVLALLPVLGQLNGRSSRISTLW